MYESPEKQPTKDEQIWSELLELLHNPEESEVHGIIRKLEDLSAEDRALIDWFLNGKGYSFSVFSAPENPEKIELYLEDFASAKNDDEKKRLAKIIAQEV